MANTTDIYWDVDGVSLQTYAQNIETLGGGRTAPPPMRGDDLVIPYKTGQRYMKKRADSRSLPLAMWVRGTDPDGVSPSTGAAKRQLMDENWRVLRNLLFQPGKQFVLRKRFTIGGVVKTAVAMAEYGGGLEPSFVGRFAAKFTVDLQLADPYFYDEAYTSTTLVTGAQTLTALGDVPTEKILVNIAGSRNQPKIRNSTLGIETTYNDSLNSGDALQLDVDQYRALYTPNGGTQQKRNTKIVHAGDPQWLRLQPGANNLVVSSTSGAGVIVLQHKAAWV